MTDKSPKVILTGTTGNLGSRVLSSLLTYNLLPATHLSILSTSASSKIPKIAHDNAIPIHTADFTSEKSLTDAFLEIGEDFTTLFLVSAPTPSVDRWAHHKRVVDAARSTSVTTVIYTSLMFGGESGMTSVAGVQQAHIKTIDYLAALAETDSNFQYIVVREGIYTESWWLYAGWQPHPIPETPVEDIVVVIPGDGPVAWVSWDDLAVGTAMVVARPAGYLGQTLRLTGSTAMTISDMKPFIKRFASRDVVVRIVDVEEAARYHRWEKKSVPDHQQWLLDSWLGWFDALKKGETSVVDPLLGQLLGRTPKGIAECAEDLFTPR